MAEYSITFARSARKELEALPQNTAARILARIETLSVNPSPSGVVKLHGQKDLWRLRVGDYRIIYKIYDSEETLDVSVIRHRRDVYRNF